MQWTYKMMPMEKGAQLPAKIERVLNEQGDAGWELCGIEYGCWIFKRRKL